MIAAQGKQFKGILDLGLMEVLVLRELVKFVADNGFRKVWFEGDADVVVDFIDSGASKKTEEHMVALEAASQARRAHRACNGMAHFVAKECLNGFLPTPPLPTYFILFLFFTIW